MLQEFDEGMYLIDKPAGMSSFGVVARVRRLSGIRKVGHAGTLDPLATGLMIVLVGKSWTRQADKFLKLDKTYEVEISLGQTSVTGDAEGELKYCSNTIPSLAKVNQIIEQFIGTIEQTPPIYSAIKIAGQPAYKRARKGEKPELKARQVKIHSIEKIKYSYPLISFTASVSSGTYIRSLATDIGKSLGTGAYMSKLRRIRIGEYDISSACILPEQSPKLD